MRFGPRSSAERQGCEAQWNAAALPVMIGLMQSLLVTGVVADLMQIFLPELHAAPLGM
ncbi:hypothetical protein [Sulfitobacter pacificus]|uniref:hypothetical protein n=1 Tax=Sulfitobacter pacificus TaxID=1499314 RepID=UPI00334129DD